MKYFELSNAQKRTIITEINNPGNETYMISFKAKFRLEDEEHVKKALSLLISENLFLRIKKDENMNFMQYYADDECSLLTDNKSSFSIVDMDGKDEDEINDYIHEFSIKAFEEIFDAPLYEFRILRTGVELLVLGRVHHLIMDGTSLSILVKELRKCVESLKKGEEYHFSPVSYQKYVEKEKEYLSSKEARLDEEFWLSNLDGYSSDWYSSTDMNISREYFQLDEDLRNSLKDLYNVDGEHISPFVLALSAISLYFARSNHTEDVVWNSVYHGRNFGEDTHNMLGMFVNMMPLRLVYDKNRSFKEVLIYTKSVLKDGLTHGKLSFNVYGGELQQKGIEPGMLSMYSIVSNSTDAPMEYLFNNSKSEFPFHIRVNPSLNDKDGLQLLTIEYNNDCFSREEIKSVVNGLEKLLHLVADNPNITSGELEIETSLFYSAGKYFKDMIQSSDGATIIPPDLSGKEGGNFKETTKSLDKESIEGFCQENSITPSELFLSATLFALVKFVFSKDIFISITTTNSSNVGKIRELQELPFYLKVDTIKSVSEYLSSVHDSFTQVTDYDYYPFTRVKSEHYILPEFLYNYGSPHSPDSYREGDLEPPKLVLNVLDEEDDFKVTLLYNDALYSSDLSRAFTDSVVTLMQKLTEPQDVLKDIALLDDPKHEKNFQMNPVKEPLLNKLFQRQVDESRDEVALIAQDGQFTYEELNWKANRIANSLIKRGVNVEDRVIFILKRDSRLVATMLGIVKAGCAFIPVDPEYPDNRIKEIILDSDARYIITNSGHSPNFQLDQAVSVDELLQEEDESNPEPDLSPEKLCYLIYTSGSTGKPKGVMLNHRGITNYVSPHPENIPIHALVNRARKMISISTVSFIVFLREMLATLTNGMPVVFASEEQAVNPLELVRLFEETGADAFGATPTRLLQYLEMEEVQKVMPRCRVIIVGGETFPPQLYQTLSQYTLAEIYNSYGPTEITIASHGKLITSRDISAGEPLLNVTDRIMDMDANPLPFNVVGELYVAGAGVALGYWNNEELTRERFINYNGLRYYNTGDLAKRDSTGELYVLGRMDTQIKLRGLRIELGEIENAIAGYDGVKSVFVMVREVHGSEHLCAYFTQKIHVDTALLRNFLFDKLPQYMVPSYLVRMDQFPLTFNGKADLRNFPDPDEKDYRPDEVIAPETDLEDELFQMCSDILETTSFGVITDLFQLGLTSLSVLKRLARFPKNWELKSM